MTINPELKKILLGALQTLIVAGFEAIGSYLVLMAKERKENESYPKKTRKKKRQNNTQQDNRNIQVM